jgi:hypothetical protein
MLNAEQIRFFKTQGYLIVPGAMDTALCRRVRDLMWQALPPNTRLQPNDPASFVGPFSEQDESSDERHMRADYRWLNRFLGVNADVIRLIYSEFICQMAQQLLGGRLRQAVVDGLPMGSHGPAWPGGPTDPALGNEGARGVYCTLPYGNKAREADGCHTDGHPFQLGIVGLLDDCPADGGAFKVWPGSHTRLFPTFALRYDQPRVPYYPHLPAFKGISHSEAYKAELSRIIDEVEPVECYGQAGDIVFWHHRLAHAAGQNYSEQIRQAVLADFWTNDLDTLRTKPVTANMWEDWSPALQRAGQPLTTRKANERSST